MFKFTIHSLVPIPYVISSDYVHSQHTKTEIRNRDRGWNEFHVVSCLGLEEALCTFYRFGPIEQQYIRKNSYRIVLGQKGIAQSSGPTEFCIHVR